MGFIQIHTQIAKALKPTRANLLSYIISFSLNGREKYCYASNDTIAESIHISKRTLDGHLKFLEKNGYIKIQKRQKADGGDTTSIKTPTAKAYSLLVDTEASEKAKARKLNAKEERKKRLETKRGKVKEKFKQLAMAESCLKNCGLDNAELTKIIDNHRKHLYTLVPKKMRKADEVNLHDLFGF